MGNDKIIIPKTKESFATEKLDYLRLRESVLMHPSLYQYEQAQIFGVSQSAISKALSKMGITHKKKRAIMKNKMNKMSMFLNKN
jgi:hypothetical protein